MMTNEQRRFYLVRLPIYTLLDGVLYWIADDKSLRIISPAKDRSQLFLEAYEGVFSGHLTPGEDRWSAQQALLVA
jgi:hypothetical protein